MVFKLLRNRSTGTADSPASRRANEADGTTQTIMNMNRPRSSSSNVSSVLRNARRNITSRPISRGSNNSRRSKNKRGTNSLFRAVSTENWELVITICETKPYKAESWHSAPGFFDAHRSSNILPLHQACVFRPPKQVLEQMVLAYPAAANLKESGYGRLPLHIACHSSASLEAIQVLLRHRPHAAYEQDAIGRVPLHYALSNGSTIDLVQELLYAAEDAGGQEAVRSATGAEDFNGWLPIHVACHMNSSLDILRAIRDANPDAVDKATKKGSTPLALLRGLSLPEKRRVAMEAVLLGQELPSNIPKQADMTKLAGIGDETVKNSDGLTLELPRDDESSLSSMDDTATVQTGTTKGSQKSKKKDQVKNNSSLRSVKESPLKQEKNSGKYLPTHSVYKNSEKKSRSRVRKLPSNSNALGAGHAIGRNSSLRTTIQLRGSSSSSSGGSGDRKDNSRRGRRNSESREDTEQINPIDFQPVSNTAEYC